MNEADDKHTPPPPVGPSVEAVNGTKGKDTGFSFRRFLRLCIYTPLFFMLGLLVLAVLGTIITQILVWLGVYS